jgi:hypothetical protein
MGTQKILGLTAGGAGVAGIAVGSVFGLLAMSAWNQQKIDCAGSTPATCSDHASALNDHSTMNTDGAISTAGFIAGGALLVTGAVLFFTAHSDAPTAPQTGWTVAPLVTRQAGGVAVGGTF